MPRKLSAKVANTLIKAGERQARAVDLYRQGWSLRKVAAELGYAGPAGAHKAIRSAIQKVPSASVNELRTELEEHARLWNERASAMHEVLEPKWKKGDLEAMAEARALDAEARKRDEHLAKLHGVYAPTKSEVTGKDGAPIISIDLSKLSDEQLERILAGNIEDFAGIAPGGDLAGSANGAGAEESTE